MATTELLEYTTIASTSTTQEGNRFIGYFEVFLKYQSH